MCLESPIMLKRDTGLVKHADQLPFLIFRNRKSIIKASVLRHDKAPSVTPHSTVNSVNSCTDVLSRCPADRSTGSCSGHPVQTLVWLTELRVCVPLLQTADCDFIQLLFLSFSVKRLPHPQPD